MSDKALCVRCAGWRASFDEVCPSCGHEPVGDGRLIAWMLSTEHFEPEALQAVADRLKAGETIQPTKAMWRKARKALGQHFSTDPGMTSRQRLALLGTSVFLTPLVGWMLWVWWRNERPRASMQALMLSAPLTVVFFGVVAALWLR